MVNAHLFSIKIPSDLGLLALQQLELGDIELFLCSDGYLRGLLVGLLFDEPVERVEEEEQRRERA